MCLRYLDERQGNAIVVVLAMLPEHRRGSMPDTAKVVPDPIVVLNKYTQLRQLEDIVEKKRDDMLCPMDARHSGEMDG